MHKSFYTLRPPAVLTLCWITGLVLGIIAATDADAVVLSLMRLSLSSRVSIVLVFLWSLVPFLIAAYAVMINQFLILYILLLFRCFGFGFGLWISAAAFGSAAWLVHPLMQFCDWMALILLGYYAFRWCTGCVQRVKRDLLICIFITAAAAVIDFAAVSPFIAMLLNS